MMCHIVHAIVIWFGLNIMTFINAKLQTRSHKVKLALVEYSKNQTRARRVFKNQTRTRRVFKKSNSYSPSSSYSLETRSESGAWSMQVRSFHIQAWTLP